MLTVHCQEVTAGGRKGFDASSHPQDVDTGIGSAFHEPGQPAAVHRRVVLDDYQHGRQHRRRNIRGFIGNARPVYGTLRWAVRTHRSFPEFHEVLEPGQQAGAACRAGSKVVAADGAVARADVRQPLQPVPAFPGPGGGDGGDSYFRRGVQAHELQHHSTRYVIDESARPGEAERTGGPQL